MQVKRNAHFMAEPDYLIDYGRTIGNGCAVDPSIPRVVIGIFWVNIIIIIIMILL